MQPRPWFRGSSGVAIGGGVGALHLGAKALEVQQLGGATTHILFLPKKQVQKCVKGYFGEHTF